MLMNKRTPIIVILATLILAAAAVGSDTDRWSVDGFKSWSKGKAEGVEVDSTGEVRPVWSTESEAIKADGAWSLAPGPAGSVYIGTGNSGKLFRYEGGSVKEVAATDKVAITRVRTDKLGRVWFAAIPGGTIYRLMKNGEVDKFAETGEEYVWDFIIDAGELIAATGPRGRVIKYSLEGSELKKIETGEKHVLTLVKGDNGKLYAGTSGEGLVLEITTDGYHVVHDFDEKEVRRLLWVGGRNGRLIAAVNETAGARPPEGVPSLSLSKVKEEAEGDDDDKGEEGGKDKETPVVTTRSAPPRGPGKVSGTVYALTETGGARTLLDLDKRAAVDLVAAGEDIYVATDQEGKIFRCRPDASDYALSFDLTQAQALSLLADERGLAYIGAGSPAGIVKVKKALPPKARFTTEVFDAGYPARWGEVDWEADGPIVVLTRSGNMRDPERGWSDWRPVLPGKPGRIISPQGRFLQVRLEWPPGSEATVRSLSIPYHAENQPQYVDEVLVSAAEQEGEGERASGPPSPGAPSAETVPPPHKTERKLAWKVTNPDNDPLKFSLFFQPDGSEQWLPIKTPEPFTKTKFGWDTASVPDGWYRLKVVAADSLANAPESAFSASGVSERFLIDNTPPELRALTVLDNKVGGWVEDKLSDVAGTQFQIDAGEWVTIAPADGVFDSSRESFHFTIPKDLPAGPHFIAVRAWDRAANLATAKEYFNR
jgi:hypothetical protein